MLSTVICFIFIINNTIIRIIIIIRSSGSSSHNSICFIFFLLVGVKFTFLDFFFLSLIPANALNIFYRSIVSAIPSTSSFHLQHYKPIPCAEKELVNFVCVNWFNLNCSK